MKLSTIRRYQVGLSQRRRGFAAVAVAAVVGLALATGGAGSAASAVQAPASPNSDDVQVLRVHSSDPSATAARLAAEGYDLLETRIGGDLVVTANANTIRQLKAAGYQIKVDSVWSGNRPELAVRKAATFFGGYRTADEYVAYLDSVVAANPKLARTFDYGDSWLKTQGSASGNDLRGVCLTNLATGGCTISTSGSKPKLLIIGAVHARELSPTEQATRLVTELTSAYGTDADITSILNNTEVWVVPVANPDGREIVERGGNAPYLQRKNANGKAPGSGACANPPTVSSQTGVDLNRNHAWRWGLLGSSTDPCDQTFRGSGPASEPETAALQTLMSGLWADQRGPNATDAAPLTTTGLMLTLHSYGNYMLFPWGDTSTDAPNDAGLRSMGFRLSYGNNYLTGQPSEVLYGVTGATDDWLYGQSGIAAGTIEIGPSTGSCSGFVPAYSCQSSFWTTMRPTFITAAKLARAPYQLALGPQTRSVSLSSSSVAAGTSVTLKATGSDSAYGTNGPARPASQTVNAARYFIDTPPWAGGTARAMAASDKNWNSTTEAVTANVATSGLSKGKHLIYVQARDSANNWGPVSAVFLNIS